MKRIARYQAGCASASATDKFLAVIAEKDADGHALVPVYYKGRIYIDLSDAGRYEEEYERLLRWVYDQPVYVKPPRGKKPAFLSETPSARELPQVRAPRDHDDCGDTGGPDAHAQSLRNHRAY